MAYSSSVLDAAIRAIHGESNLSAVMPALNNWSLATVIALAPDTHPLVRDVATIFGHLFALINESTAVDPVIHEVMRRMIGTLEGRDALRSWATIAPPGWGRAYVDTLVQAVNNDTCDAVVAAALIGPVDASASLLSQPSDIAFTIRRWRSFNPNAPGAWLHALGARERKRLIDSVQSDSFAVALCLPWLPPDTAHQMRINDDDLAVALHAFADASPMARAQHAALVQRLVARAQPKHLGALTRLACAMQGEEVWARVVTLIRKSPDSSSDVVVVAPWNDLPTEVRDIVADLHPAIGAARGRCDSMTLHAPELSAVAFFAALDPKIWDALNPDVQRRWSRALKEGHTHLAVRSLGLLTEFLARTTLSSNLIDAALRHVRDAATLRNAFLPIALREVHPSAAHALMTTFATLPPDPGAFFSIASGHPDPNVITSACAALRTSADLACAVTLQRIAKRCESVRDRCVSLKHALRGWSWDALNPILLLLDSSVRAAFIPNLDAMVARLARPDRRMEMRQALACIASLPPEVAVPTFVALNLCDPWRTSDAAHAIADTLCACGDVFLSIVDAIADDGLRFALLPLPKDEALANALCALACADPPTAQRLAHALYALQHDDMSSANRRAALNALLEAPSRHAFAIWQSLDGDKRRVIVGAIADALQCNEHTVPILARSSDFLRTIWNILPQEARMALGDHPALSDLSTGRAELSDGACTALGKRHHPRG